MQRLLLPLLLIAFSASMLAQDTAGGAAQQSNTQPQVMASPQNTTPVVAQPPLDQRLTTPPIVTYATTAPAPAGATNATPGNRAGATSATLNPEAVTEMNAATATASGSPAMDLGPSGGSAWDMSSNGQSLAQASAQARVSQSKDHPRLYTNSDIARLQQEQGGFGNQAPNAGPVTNQNTMPGSDVQGNMQPPSAAAAPQAQPAPQTAPPANQNQQQVPSPFAPKPQPTQPPQS